MHTFRYGVALALTAALISPAFAKNGGDDRPKKIDICVNAAVDFHLDDADGTLTPTAGDGIVATGAIFREVQFQTAESPRVVTSMWRQSANSSPVVVCLKRCPLLQIETSPTSIGNFALTALARLTRAVRYEARRVIRKLSSAQPNVSPRWQTKEKVRRLPKC
jgi:hypothetical protein